MDPSRREALRAAAGCLVILGLTSPEIAVGQVATSLLADLDRSAPPARDLTEVRAKRCGETTIIASASTQGVTVWLHERREWRPIVVLPMDAEALSTLHCASARGLLWVAFTNWRGMSEVLAYDSAAGALERIAHVRGDLVLEGRGSALEPVGNGLYFGIRDRDSGDETLSWKAAGEESFVASEWAGGRSMRLLGEGFAFEAGDDGGDPSRLWRVDERGGAEVVEEMPFGRSSRILVGPLLASFDIRDEFWVRCLTESGSTLRLDVRPRQMAVVGESLFVVADVDGQRDLTVRDCGSGAVRERIRGSFSLFDTGTDVIAVECPGGVCDWRVYSSGAFHRFEGPSVTSFEKMVRVGDRIVAGTEAGEVFDIELRSDRAIVSRFDDFEEPVDTLVVDDGDLTSVSWKHGRGGHLQTIHEYPEGPDSFRALAIAGSGDSNVRFLGGLARLVVVGEIGVGENLAQRSSLFDLDDDGAADELAWDVRDLVRHGDRWSFSARSSGALKIAEVGDRGVRALVDDPSVLLEASSGAAASSSASDVVVLAGEERAIFSRDHGGDWRRIAGLSSGWEVSLAASATAGPLSLISTSTDGVHVIDASGARRGAAAGRAAFVLGIVEEVLYFTTTGSEFTCSMWALDLRSGRSGRLEVSARGCGDALRSAQRLAPRLLYAWSSGEATTVRVVDETGSKTIATLPAGSRVEFATESAGTTQVPYVVVDSDGGEALWIADLDEGASHAMMTLGEGEKIRGLSRVGDFAVFWRYGREEHVGWEVQAFRVGDASPFVVARPDSALQGLAPLRSVRMRDGQNGTNENPMFEAVGSIVAFGAFDAMAGFEPRSFPIDALECGGCCSDAHCQEGLSCLGARCSAPPARLEEIERACGCRSSGRGPGGRATGWWLVVVGALAVNRGLLRWSERRRTGVASVGRTPSKG